MSGCPPETALESLSLSANSSPSSNNRPRYKTSNVVPPVQSALAHNNIKDYSKDYKTIGGAPSTKLPSVTVPTATTASATVPGSNTVTMVNHVSNDGVSSTLSDEQLLAPDDPSAAPPTKHDFMVSFLVDARGGSMTGCRYSGVKVRQKTKLKM
jgi:hypothetical protein